MAVYSAAHQEELAWVATQGGEGTRKVSLIKRITCAQAVIAVSKVREITHCVDVALRPGCVQEEARR